MGAFWSRVSQDADLAAMYHARQGRPSIPPSLLSGVLILQYVDDLSDREAADRVRFDLRWKLALGLCPWTMAASTSPPSRAFAAA